MKLTVIAALAATASAALSQRRFSVLRFYGNGPLMDCRIDAVVQPGGPSAHVHTFMGGNAISWNSTGQDLLGSSCSNALPKADKSAYWFPKLYFKDPADGKFEPVPFFYSNVYYFFDATNDNIKAFPLGLSMVSGNAMIRTPPVKTNIGNLDPSKGPVSPAKITCPRSNFNPPSWPAGSDGSSAGIGDPNNKGEGLGFPFQDCDGYASPMRVDVHMPSCYNPEAGLTNFRSNMAFPSAASNGRLDCPPGWIHVPHMFFETYWDTHKFLPRFQSLIGKESPFVFSNGDTTGFSAHADFISAWDERALQQIIDNCNNGHEGLHKCPGLIGGVNSESGSCKATCPVQEVVNGKLDELPGNNKLSGWKYGSGGAATNPPSSNPPTNPPAASSAASVPAVSSAIPDADPYAQNPPNNGAAVPPATTLVPSIKNLSVAPKPTGEPDVPAPAPGGDKDAVTIQETVTVWKTTTVYGAPGSAPTSSPATGSTGEDMAGFKYVGCYLDASDRVLAGEIRPNLGRITNKLCVKHCASKGFSIAGTEYGGQCYCGNALSKVEKLDEGKCGMACEGGNGQCGGSWALSLYTKDGEVPGAAGEKRRRHVHDHMMHHRRSW